MTKRMIKVTCDMKNTLDDPEVDMVANAELTFRSLQDLTGFDMIGPTKGDRHMVGFFSVPQPKAVSFCFLVDSTVYAWAEYVG